MGGIVWMVYNDIACVCLCLAWSLLHAGLGVPRSSCPEVPKASTNRLKGIHIVLHIYITYIIRLGLPTCNHNINQFATQISNCYHWLKQILYKYLLIKTEPIVLLYVDRLSARIIISMVIMHSSIFWGVFMLLSEILIQRSTLLLCMERRLKYLCKYEYRPVSWVDCRRQTVI